MQHSRQDTGIAMSAVHEQAMLTVCTGTLDPPCAKREHSLVHVPAYLQQAVQLASTVQLTPAHLV